jgi:hypothetical protein
MLIKLKLQYILLLMVLGIAQISYSCDMSAFDQTDFSNRCQRLIDLCQKAYITLASQHPDADKRLSEVSKDWVDFYLSHGKREVQPPNMSFISPDIWEKNLKDLGIKFENFIHKKIDSKTYQKIVLTLNLFKNEETLTQLHNSFKVSNLCERQLNKIDNLVLWVNARLMTPYNLVYNYEKDFSDIVLETNVVVEDYLVSIEKLRNYINNQEKSPEILQIFFDNLNQEIDQTIAEWEKRYFYK